MCLPLDDHRQRHIKQYVRLTGFGGHRPTVDGSWHPISVASKQILLVRQRRWDYCGRYQKLRGGWLTAILHIGEAGRA